MIEAAESDKVGRTQLFLIGIELTLKRLLNIRRLVVGLGGGVGAAPALYFTYRGRDASPRLAPLPR